MTTSPLRLGFAGTPTFSATALQGLLSAGYSVPLVLTQPDRPAGRGLALTQSPVKTLALAHQIPVWQPTSLREPTIQEELRAVPLDLLIVAAYGLILPPTILSWPRLGCWNIHASLLPRWRGAAPIQRAILAGDSTTGICIMQMEKGLDTGPILQQVSLPITENDTSGTLHDKLAQLGVETLLSTLSQLNADRLSQATPQASVGITYADKINKQEAAIDWTQPAHLIERQIRAFNPSPGAFTSWQGEPLKIWQASVVASNPRTSTGSPGLIQSISNDGLCVVCGQDLLRLEVLQRPGGKRISAQTYLSPSKAAIPQIGDFFGLHVQSPCFPPDLSCSKHHVLP